MIYFIKIILSEYKKIIIGISAAVFLFFMLSAFFEYIEKRSSLIDKFTFGIVVEDENPYLDIMLNALFSRDDLKNIMEFEKMDLSAAESKLKSQEIPCYIIIEKGFTDSVITGENKNIIFVGNRTQKLKYNISEALVKAGTAFLTSSQSGIYATIDYAYEKNVPNEIIQDKIVMAINLEFGKALLSYKEYFDTKYLNPFGDFSLKTHYLYSALIFMVLINIASFFEPLKKILDPAILARLKILGFDYYKAYAMAFCSLFLLILIVTLPLFYFFKFKIFILALILSSLIIFTSIVFKESASAGLFIFSFAIISLFISGGILPKGILPEFINKISFLSLNNYFIFEKSKLFLYGIGFFIIFNALGLLYLRKILGRGEIGF